MTTIIYTLEQPFAMLRLPPQEVLPAWVQSSVFYSVSRSPDELSIVCAESVLPAEIPETWAIARGWALLHLPPLDLELTGIAARFSGIIAAEEINLNIIATFDTDYIMIPVEKAERALRALRNSGYSIQRSGFVGNYESKILD